MGLGGQFHAPAALPPGNRPGTHCMGGWVGPRAVLDGCGNSRHPPRFDPWAIQPVASRYTDWDIPAHRVLCIIYNSTCYCTVLCRANSRFSWSTLPPAVVVPAGPPDPPGEGTAIPSFVSHCLPVDTLSSQRTWTSINSVVNTRHFAFSSFHHLTFWRRSLCSHCLRRGSAAARLLGFRVWIPSEALMYVVSVVR